MYDFLQEYVLRIDPVTNLGLSAESVFSYHIGDIVRTKGNRSFSLQQDASLAVKFISNSF